MAIRSLKIKKLTLDNKKRCFYIYTYKGIMPFPYSKLHLIPSNKNPIQVAYPDKELGCHAFTYVLESGVEDTVPVDAVLEYNKDPEYMRKMLLYKLSLKAQEILEKKKINKREIIRRLGTSPTQFYRLIDQAFYGKTVDQMIKLLSALDYSVEVVVKKVA